MTATIKRIDKPLADLFRDWERRSPDVMEPYSIRMAEAESADERRDVMRAGLRETFHVRWPMPERHLQQHREAS